MGFTKLVRSAKPSAKPVEKLDRHADKFKPSTAKELKQYAKNAKRKNRERAEGKNASRGTRLLMGERRKEYRDMFARHDKFDVLAQNVIQYFAEQCKEIGEKVPRYREYLPRAEADARFVFEVNHALARMSWIQLSKLVMEAVNSPIVTRDYSEAYNFAAHALLTLVLRVNDEDGTYRLTDLSVLKLWPVESMKRPSKEDRTMSKKEAAQVAAGKLKAKKAAVEDDEDEDLESEEAEEEEEEEEEAEEESSDDEESEDDESEEESEDDESEESDDEDSEDEEEKPTAKKRGQAAKEKSVKKSAKPEKSEKHDRQRPDKMKLKKEIPAVKKGAAKKEKPVKVKKERAPRAPKIELGPNTVLAKVKDRPRGGPKTTVLNLMPKKGIKLKDLEKAAKEEGVNSAKVSRFAAMMVKRGFAKIVE